MAPPVVRSLREQIREFIVDGIVSGRWKPGERIVERGIATELQVSQTPVREALRELEVMRLIESAPNKGVRVPRLAAADLEEIYPVRAGLEQIAAELAAPRLRQELSALQAEVALLQKADEEGDAGAQVRHTVAFHRELVRASGNSVLLHTWESLGIEVWTALSIRWLGTRQRLYAGGAPGGAGRLPQGRSTRRRAGQGACARRCSAGRLSRPGEPDPPFRVTLVTGCLIDHRSELFWVLRGPCPHGTIWKACTMTDATLSALDHLPDPDPEETGEWAASLDAVTRAAGPERAAYLMRRTVGHAQASGLPVPALVETEYVNTIPTAAEPGSPATRRWNGGSPAGTGGTRPRW